MQQQEQVNQQVKFYKSGIFFQINQNLKSTPSSLLTPELLTNKVEDLNKSPGENSLQKSSQSDPLGKVQQSK